MSEPKEASGVPTSRRRARHGGDDDTAPERSPTAREPTASRWGRRRDRVALSAGTAAAAILFGWLGCEVVLRLSAPGENLYATATLGIFAPDPELGWVLAPNLDVPRQWAGRRITIRTDDQGRRVSGRAPALAPAAGGEIAFAGDSYVFGNEVEAEETFVDRVGTALGRETANLGVGGYRLGQSTLALSRYLDGHPEVGLGVLVLYIGNDLEDGALAPPALHVNAQGHLVSAAPGPTADLRAFALRRSRVLFAIHAAWRRLRSKAVAHERQLDPSVPAPAAERSRWIYDERQLRGDRLLEHRAVLARLRDQARRRGVPVLVVLLPERGQVDRALGDLPNRALGAMLADLGLERLDLLPAMRSAARDRPPLWNDIVEGHLSTAGHQVVADLLIDRVAAASESEDAPH